MPWCHKRWEGAQSAPLMLFTGKWLLTYQEKRGKVKRKNGEENYENCKRESGKFKMQGKKYENEQRTLFYSFCKTTEIYLGSTKMEISTGKEKVFHAGIKLAKVTSPPPPPPKNIPLTPLADPTVSPLCSLCQNQNPPNWLICQKHSVQSGRERQCNSKKYSGCETIKV